MERQPEEIGRFVGSWKCVNKSGISLTVGNFHFFRQRERERVCVWVSRPPGPISHIHVGGVRGWVWSCLYVHVNLSEYREKGGFMYRKSEMRKGIPLACKVQVLLYKTPVRF